MSRFLNKKYSGLTAYTPGEQPRDLQYIKLNTNESPYPPGAGVSAAITAPEIGDLRLYSDPTCTALRERFADLYKVDLPNVFVANGSDDILNFAFMAFGGDGVVFADITYGFYPVYAALHGIDAVEIPLKEDFSIDPTGFVNAGRMVVIANPNAPTGIAMPLGEIEGIVKSNPKHVVLIDEAYVDFGGSSALSLTKKYDNLLVVGTFSKSRSLAGARLGFAVASEAIIEDLERLKYSTNPYNVNRLTQTIGIAALGENGYYMDNCKKIIETREYTAAALGELGFRVLPSSANFIFAESGRIGGAEFYRQLKARGILVRHFDSPKICNFNRITIGTKEQMEKFVNTTREILCEPQK